MENKIKDAFDSLKMDDRCAERIEAKLREPKAAPRWVRYAVAAAACLALAVLMCLHPSVVQALEDTFIEPIRNLASQSTEPQETVPNPLHAPDWRKPDGSAVFEDEEKVEDTVSQAPISFMPFCLEMREDGLYFTANGENIEISSQISHEIPFTYVFTDENGIMHYMAVGGVFDPEKSPYGGVGYHEWLRVAAEAEDGRWGGWISGGGGTIPNDPEDVWIWLETAKEEFDVPWS